MRHATILLLVATLCFANIIPGTLLAKEIEGPEIKDDTLPIQRDPFVSIIDIKKATYGKKTEEVSLEKLLFPMVLRGVMLQEGNSVAIINEEIVKEGHFWRDLYVERIDKQGVTFNYQGKSLQLTIQQEPSEIKKK